MAKHTDANNNVWYDGITLSGTCTYVHVKDGCTGTITDCNYMEIGENNVNLALDGVDYCTIGDNNRNITISDSDYIIVGSECEDVMIGLHDQNNERFRNYTGASSITVGYKTINAQITGYNSKYQEAKSIQAEGAFNNVEKSGVVFIEDANGNELKQSTLVDLKETNNNSLETTNINLTKKEAFMDYATIKDVLRAESKIPVINRQADANGDILDISLNTIITKGNGSKGSTHYTKINGIWTLVGG